MTVKDSKIDTEVQTRVKNIKQAIAMVQDLKLYCEQEGLHLTLTHIDALEEGLKMERYKRKAEARKTKMSNFSKPLCK